MKSLRAALETRGDAFVVVREDGSVRAAEILTRARRFEDALVGRGASRLLSLDDDPATLLALLVLAEQRPAGLILGRVSTGVEQLPASLEPQLIVYGPDQIAACAPSAAPCQVVSAPGIFLLTSGTTGPPKVVQQTLRALTLRMQGESLARNRSGIWLLTYETHSFAGLQVVLSAALSEGVLVVGQGRTPAELGRLARRYGVTHLSGTPTFWRSLLLALDSGGLPALRQITLGGEAADQATLDRLQRTFPQARVTHIYASTEAGALFSVSDGRAGFPAAWLEQELPGGVRLRVRDGVLEVQTPSRMQGYVGDQGAPWTEDGWLRTGDLVEIEADRVLFRGRHDQVVNVAGLKVFPEEVEAYLLTHPVVGEARVYAIPNPLTGAVLGAEVVPAAGAPPPEVLEKELLAWCLKGLPPHKVPRRFQIVEHIAVSSSWKKTGPR
jgi:acyl-coenzyme A synthetase/AMP-(fatty) acid ligase